MRQVAAPNWSFGNVFSIPLRLSSENELRRNHPIHRGKVLKVQRTAVLMLIGRRILGLYPCTVTMTRLGPRQLDNDNLTGALKHVRDAIATALGIDDADPRVIWVCAQEKGPYGLRIEVTAP